MVGSPTTYFPPPAAPKAGRAEDQIRGAANPVRRGVRGYQNSGPPGQIQIESMVKNLLVK
jgi:hypothetical protein